MDLIPLYLNGMWENQINHCFFKTNHNLLLLGKVKIPTSLTLNRAIISTTHFTPITNKIIVVGSPAAIIFFCLLYKNHLYLLANYTKISFYVDKYCYICYYKYEHKKDFETVK